MKSYKDHLESTKSIGEKVNTIRKPVYRGSAIFPVISNNKLDSRILFMGYWLVKNALDEIGLLITLRSQHGKILFRKTQQITTPSAREINIKGLLKEAEHHDNDFLGSVELEVFSCRDLVFPYPAFVLNYYNEYGSAAVHTTGRIYNDLEDQISNESSVKECGFDLFPGEDMDPFFTFVNGYDKYESTPIDIELIISSGLVYSGSIDLGKIEPFEALIVRLKDFLPIDKYLDGQVGTIKIGHSLNGFFPRFIAGNLSKSTGAASITHTFYDNSNNTSDSAYWENEHIDMMYDAGIFIPLFLEKDLYTQLKLYPIYSPSEHILHILFFNESGMNLHTLNNFKHITSEFSEFIEIDFEQLINELKLPKSELKGAMLIKEWKDKSKIPTRLKYGLNVGKRNSKFDLPTNICFGSQISNINIASKPSTFKWCPLLNNGYSIVVIENSSFLKNYNRVADIEVTFYRTDLHVIKRTYQLLPNGQIRLSLDEEIKEFASNEAVWVTINANNPFIKAWYFEFNESGIVGGDHSF